MRTRSQSSEFLLDRMPSKYRKVVSCVSREFGISRVELFSPTRGSPNSAKARQVLMYVLHLRYGENYTRVGELLGRYRKTVSHGVGWIRIDRTFYPGLDDQVKRIEEQLQT